MFVWIQICKLVKIAKLITPLLKSLNWDSIHIQRLKKKGFDGWLANVPENSFEAPIIAQTLDDVIAVLPKFPNYTYEPINIFFHCDTSDASLEEIFKTHIAQNQNFEISVVKHNKDIISVGLGSKIRNTSTIPEGEFFGHNHPILELGSKTKLPSLFIKALLPSPGDIKGYSKFVETIKNGTRIYSPYGFVIITPLESFNIANIADYSSKYFQLFNDKNEFDWNNDRDVSNYFESKFNLKLEFYLSE